MASARNRGDGARTERNKQQKSKNKTGRPLTTKTQRGVEVKRELMESNGELGRANSPSARRDRRNQESIREGKSKHKGSPIGSPTLCLVDLRKTKKIIPTEMTEDGTIGARSTKRHGTSGIIRWIESSRTEQT